MGAIGRCSHMCTATQLENCVEGSSAGVSLLVQGFCSKTIRDSRAFCTAEPSAQSRVLFHGFCSAFFGLLCRAWICFPLIGLLPQAECQAELLHSV